VAWHIFVQVNAQTTLDKKHNVSMPLDPAVWRPGSRGDSFGQDSTANTDVHQYHPSAMVTRNRKIEIPVLAQKVDVWYGISKQKPDANYQATVDADQISFYRNGVVRYGEWFLDGQRLPGGDHREGLPEVLTEAAKFPAELPDLAETTDFHDGCRCQVHSMGFILTSTCVTSIATC
jgi:hypothetical protein